jgi:hypothetical protein
MISNDFKKNLFKRVNKSTIALPLNTLFIKSATNLSLAHTLPSRRWVDDLFDINQLSIS